MAAIASMSTFVTCSLSFASALFFLKPCFCTKVTRLPMLLAGVRIDPAGASADTG